jgi:TRAP-type uncharacterized transport system fused permease subunit
VKKSAREREKTSQQPLKSARRTRGQDTEALTRAGITWMSVLEALEEGAKNTLAVAMACACAGIVIACVTITGLGIVFTQVVIVRKRPPS